MPAFFFAAAVLFGTAAAPLTIVDEFGKPVAAAAVVFVDERGERDAESTDRAGKASARAGFAAVEAQVSAGGFVPKAWICERPPAASRSSTRSRSSEASPSPPVR